MRNLPRIGQFASNSADEGHNLPKLGSRNCLRTTNQQVLDDFGAGKDRRGKLSRMRAEQIFSNFRSVRFSLPSSDSRAAATTTRCRPAPTTPPAVPSTTPCPRSIEDLKFLGAMRRQPQDFGRSVEAHHCGGRTPHPSLFLPKQVLQRLYKGRLRAFQAPKKSSEGLRSPWKSLERSAKALGTPPRALEGP